MAINPSDRVSARQRLLAVGSLSISLALSTSLLHAADASGDTTMPISNRPAVVELDEGSVVVTAEIAAPLERTFRALASPEVVDWWIRPGVFNTEQWTGEVRVGGHWQAAGLFRGRRYVSDGEFLEVDPPRLLVHTWHGVGAPGPTTTLTYRLEAINHGTRITLRQAGFASREASADFGIGWVTSFERLAAIISAEHESRH